MPPWMPWVEYGRYKGSNGLDPGGILEGVMSKLAGMGGQEGYSGCVEQYRQRYNEYVSGLDEGDYTLRHSLLTPVLVHTLLSCRGGKLEGLAELVGQAMEHIAGRARELTRAASLADVLNDQLIQSVVAGSKDNDARLELALASPFNLSLGALEVRDDVTEDEVASYIVEYSTILVEAAARATEYSGSGMARIVLRDLAFLLLEPVWYTTVETKDGRAPVPPASISYPAYTVFEKINAILAALNWTIRPNVSGDAWEPNGYLAEVDLAGVQSWIRESRRLRDLWASSWLASLLAWKAVEWLVDEYGPGVLVQPPARLHPFLAAKLAGALEKPENSENSNQRGEQDGGDEFLAELLKLLGLARYIGLERPADADNLKLLGLARGWPVDAMVPTRYLLALPPDVDPERLKKTVDEKLSWAWQDIINEVANVVGIVIKALEHNGIDDIEAGVPAALAEAMKGIEPPLAARIHTASVGEAYRKALEEAGDKLREYTEKLDKHTIARILFYPYALGMLYKPGRPVLKVPGRRVGSGYYNYARMAHAIYYYSRAKQPDSKSNGGGRRSLPLCTVCGAAPVIVDGTRLAEYSKKIARWIKEYGPAEDGTVLLRVAEVFDEKLCPYCLTKRLLRTLLQRRSGRLAKRLVGLGMSPEARMLLDFNTIDALTSRLALNKDNIECDAGDLAEKMIKFSKDNIDQMLNHLPGSLLTPALVANTLEPYRSSRKDSGHCRNSREDSVFFRAAVSILLEVLHDERMRREALNEIDDIMRKIENESSDRKDSKDDRNERCYLEFYEVLREKLERAGDMARKARAKTSLLLMDGDFLGKGVLAGRLGVDAKAYARSVLETAGYCIDDESKLDFFEAIAGASGKALAGGAQGHGSESRCIYCKGIKLDPSTVVTLAYHITVSRSLAVQAHIDRSIVNNLGGMLIYAGGDDLLAVLPPIGYPKNGDSGAGVTFPVAEAARAARLSYWGLHKDYNIKNGYNILKTGPGRDAGETSGFTAFAPALAAHGRSGVIYIFDSARPLWLVLSHAWDMENDKDTFTQGMVKGMRDGVISVEPYNGVCKDMLAVYNDNTGASLLPFRLGYKQGDEEYSSLVAGLVEAVKLASETVRLEANKGEKPRTLSPRVYTTILEDYRIIEEAAAKSPELAVELLKTVIERAKQEQAATGNRWTILASPEAYKTVVASAGEAAKSMPEASLYALEKSCKIQGGILPVQAVLAARALHYSK